MDNQYYLEYYALERNHWWFKARTLILHDQISKISKGRNLKILNVGAATGATSTMLSKFGEVISVEYESDCCKFLKEELNIKAIEASITSLPFENDSFDLVCAFDVVEHVEDDALATSELRRVVKKNGHVFCTVPSFMFLWSKHDDVNHHIRRYTASNFKALFKSYGEIIFSSYFNTFLFLPIASFRLLSKLLPKNFMRHGAGSDFTVGSKDHSGKIPYHLMSAERKLLNKYIALPFGVSYLLIWQKKISNIINEIQ